MSRGKNEDVPAEAPDKAPDSYQRADWELKFLGGAERTPEKLPDQSGGANKSAVPPTGESPSRPGTQGSPQDLASNENEKGMTSPEDDSASKGRRAKPVNLPLWGFWALGCLGAMGAVLSAFNNAVLLFTPWRAIGASIVLVAIWVWLERTARRRGVRWSKNGRAQVVFRLKTRHRMPLFLGIVLVWVPAVIRNRVAPPLPVELGSVYKSNLAAIFSDNEPSPELAARIKSELVLTNVSQTTLVNLEVLYYKTTIVGVAADWLLPYSPPRNSPGYHSGADTGAAQAAGQSRPFLRPGDSLTLDVQQQLTEPERQLLLSYDCSDTSDLRMRPLAAIEFGVRNASDRMRGYGLSLMQWQSPRNLRTEFFGVLLWAIVTYQVQERINTLFFFGAQLRAIAQPVSGIGRREPAKYIHDFMLSLPYAFVETIDFSGSSTRREVIAPIATNQEIVLPSTPGMVIKDMSFRAPGELGNKLTRFWQTESGPEGGFGPFWRQDLSRS